MLHVALLSVLLSQTKIGDVSYVDDVVSIPKKGVLYPSGNNYVPMLLDRYGRYVPSGSPAISRDKYKNDELKSTSIRSVHEKYAYASRKPLYQFASYRLVRGLVATGTFAPGRFVPELDSVVITLDTYMASKEIKATRWRDDSRNEVPPPAITNTSIGIFNLPGYFVPTTRIIKKANLFDFPSQPNANAINAFDSPPLRQFQPDKSQRIAIRFGDFIYTGTIDIELGEIVYDDVTLRINARTQPRPPLPPFLMQPRKPDESVYELRAGRLIPGFLHQLAPEDWLFVPDIGGKVIDAKTYLQSYQPASRRIYNLPGQFVLKPDK